MLPNTLSIIESVLKRELNDYTLLPEVLAFFACHKKGMRLYPGTFKRHFSLELPQICTILMELENMGVLQSYFELYCSNCQKSMGTVELFCKLPATFECKLCHHMLCTLENSVIVFRVVRDD